MTPAAPTYVALGDSTGVGVGARGGGYPARLAARSAAWGAPVSLVNLCASGATVADVAAAQLGPALEASPAVASVAVGINDVLRGTDPSAFTRAYEVIAARLERSGAAVLVVNLPDLVASIPGVPPQLRDALHLRVETVNGRIAEIARRHRFTLVDLFGATAGELARGGGGLLSDDRFHPSDLGYERWADVMQPAFERAVRAAR